MNCFRLFTLLLILLFSLIFQCSIYAGTFDNEKEIKPLRIAFVGDSVTFGNGLLDEVFITDFDLKLRSKLATSLWHENLSYSGKTELLKNRKLFQGTATKMKGAGSEVRFSMTGNELAIVQALERDNANASIIELFVDGKLHDTFSNFNPTDIGQENKQFAGDGKTILFDLGRAFTYHHDLKVNGHELKGRIFTGNYGDAFDETQDYMIIKKYGPNEQGNPEVHHYLWFKNPPKLNDKISVSFMYGESITYAKTSVGELDSTLTSELESPFGDKNTELNFDSVPNMTTGLDFRQTDERALKTYRFDSYKEREFILKIKELDRRAAQGGSPYFIVNFVTNRFHHMMNAGIVGFRADLLNSDTGLRNIKEIVNFKPDIAFLEYGPNDDFASGNQFVAARSVKNVGEEELRRYPTLWLKSSKYNAPDSYSIETSELLIRNITRNSVTIDHKNVEFGNIKKGELLLIGDYFGDNRRMVSRVIEHWDNEKKEATFSEPIDDEMLNKLSGKHVRIKSVEGFMNHLTKTIDILRHSNSNIRIALVDTGLNNFRTRLLTGYPEKFKELADEKGLTHIDIYNVLSQWQYSQPRDGAAYIGLKKMRVTDGKNTYFIVDENGRDINEANGKQIRNFSVLINGEERLGRGCEIDGGYTLGFMDVVDGRALEFKNWEGRIKNIGHKFVPAKLTCSPDIIPKDSRVDIRFSTNKWSNDDTHITTGAAPELYAQKLYSHMESLADFTPPEYVEHRLSANGDIMNIMFDEPVISDSQGIKSRVFISRYGGDYKELDDKTSLSLIDRHLVIHFGHKLESPIKIKILGNTLRDAAGNRILSELVITSSAEENNWRTDNSYPQPHKTVAILAIIALCLGGGMIYTIKSVIAIK